MKCGDKEGVDERTPTQNGVPGQVSSGEEVRMYKRPVSADVDTDSDERNNVTVTS